MNKEEKKWFSIDKYTKKIILIGFLALFGSLCFLIYKANSTKTEIASNFLNSYINKDFMYEDKTLYYKYKADNKFNCSSYFTIDNGLKSKTTCSIDNPKLVFYSGSKEDNIISLDKLTFSVNSSLLVTQISDFIKNGFKLNVEANSISIEDIILNNGINLSPDLLSENSKKDLSKIFNEFKKVNLNGTAEIKPINLKEKFFNVNINGLVLANNWGLKQEINFNFVTYDKPKEILFKETVSESEAKEFNSPSDAVTELKIVLPKEMFINKNYMAFSATKSVDQLIDIFYTYYKIIYETKINKNEYNKNYLNLDTDKLVDISTFKKIMKDLTAIAANEYNLSTNAPLMTAIKNLFAGNFGSCYKTEVIDPRKNVSIEYLMELINKNPVEGYNLTEQVYKSNIIECTKSSEDCFKKCEF